MQWKDHLDGKKHRKSKKNQGEFDDAYASDVRLDMEPLRQLIENRQLDSDGDMDELCNRLF